MIATLKQKYFSLMRRSLFPLQHALVMQQYATQGPVRPAAAIVFSMDRALQLHALIGSYYDQIKEPGDLHILYRASTPAHEQAYREVFALCAGKNILPVKQTSKASFRPQLLNILRTIKTPQIYFLVDDDIFIEHIDLLDLYRFDTRRFVPSLRLAPHLKRAYTVQKDQPVPNFDSNIIPDTDKKCWLWAQGQLDWNYPLSVDGHLFSRREMLLMCSYIPFHSPTTFEGELQVYKPLFAKRYGVCYTKSKLVNIPCNKVQQEEANIHSGELHQDDLRAFWEKGEQIDRRPLYGITPESAHQDISLTFIKRAIPITVVMPVYNGEKYVQASVDSILRQTFPDFELVIINDGSTDGSAEVIRSLNDRRVRVVNNAQNLGLTKTRNIGLNEVHTDLIAFLDADDIAYPTRLEEQVAFLAAHPKVGLVGAWVKVIDSAGRPTGSIRRLPVPSAQIGAHLLFINNFAQSTVMLRKSALPQEHYREDFPPTEDYDLWVRIAQGVAVANLQKVLVDYRVHQGNISQTKAEIKEMAVTKIITYQLKALGISPTEVELTIHRYLGEHAFTPTLALFKSTEAWLTKITTANATTKIYAGPLLDAVISERWFTFCNASTALGWTAWQHFWHSRFSNGTHFRLASLLKFALKCLLHKRN